MNFGELLQLSVAGCRERHDEQFRLPADWSTTVYGPRGRPPMDTEEIQKVLAEPDAGERISVAAQGAGNAVILVDDFRRPTPVERLSMAVIDELQTGGLDADDISVVVANGAHRVMDDGEVRARMGASLGRVGNVVSHDAFNEKVTFCGLTPAGTPVLVNDTAARAEFSVSISSTYPHPLTAWGGGAKIVLPGISHVSSIDYHHGRIDGGGWAGDPENCPSRGDIEDAADIFGLDVAVCAVVNAEMQLCGLAAGEPTEAHRRSVAIARQAGHTPVTGEQYDLVIANTYPYDGDPTQFSKSLAPARKFECPVLLIADFADPCSYHGLYDGPPGPYREKRRPQLPEHSDELLMGADVFLYTPQYGNGFVPEDRSWYCDGDWESLMEGMARRFPDAPVAVLPAAPLQIPHKLD